MPTQKEMMTSMLEAQKKQGKLLTEIDICLRGPNYDPSDGGLVAEVHKNTDCIKDIKKKQNKIVTWGITLFGAINVAGIIAAIFNAVRHN
jgi:GH35 family endo-1,4-beta-xylanase